MLSCPKVGTKVQLWYGARWRPFARLHGLQGTVVARSTGPGPRNHCVLVGELRYSVPGGNLRPWKDSSAL